MSDKLEATLQCNLTPDTTWREVRVEVNLMELGLCGLIDYSFRDLGHALDDVQLQAPVPLLQARTIRAKVVPSEQSCRLYRPFSSSITSGWQKQRRTMGK